MDENEVVVVTSKKIGAKLFGYSVCYNILFIIVLIVIDVLLMSTSGISLEDKDFLSSFFSVIIFIATIGLINIIAIPFICSLSAKKSVNSVAKEFEFTEDNQTSIIKIYGSSCKTFMLVLFIILWGFEYEVLITGFRYVLPELLISFAYFYFLARTMEKSAKKSIDKLIFKTQENVIDKFIENSEHNKGGV